MIPYFKIHIKIFVLSFKKFGQNFQKMPLLSQKRRWEIIFLNKHEYGPKWGSKKIANYMNCSPNIVQRWIKRYESTGDVQDLPGRGRKRKFSEEEVEKFVKQADGKEMTANDIAIKYFDKSGQRVSTRTIRRRLNEQGLKYKNKIPKPLLTKNHREKRFAWGNNNSNRDWSSVIFSDESSFHLNTRRKKVWIRRGSIKIFRTVKHPMKVHVWACFSSKGWGNIFCFTKNLNTALMCNIYKRQLLPSSKKMFGDDVNSWSLVEDNDPKHMSKKCKDLKCELGINRLDFPPQSGDQNPIENVWAVLKSNVAERQPKSIKALKRCIKKEWAKLPVDFAQRLVVSMPHRIEAVINASGDYTMY